MVECTYQEIKRTKHFEISLEGFDNKVPRTIQIEDPELGWKYGMQFDANPRAVARELRVIADFLERKYKQTRRKK